MLRVRSDAQALLRRVCGEAALVKSHNMVAVDDDFSHRRDQSFWDGIAGQVDRWDELIDDFNRSIGSQAA